MSWWNRHARGAFLAAGRHASHGQLELVCPDRSFQLGRPGSQPTAMMVVHDERVFRRILTGGEMGLSEAFVDGDWSSPDLVALIRLALRNNSAMQRLNTTTSWLSRQAQRAAHLMRSNTLEGSRRNIAAHYDLGNDFFSLFLDRELMYSSAWYASEHDTLEQAQLHKLDRICRKLQLTRDDHVLEIGTGWGGFAAHAATHYGCRVTTTTISREQHAYAAERFSRLGEAGERITLLMDDYRQLTGRFDKIVSIEMFEAVGLAHYDTFFATCDRLLSPTGAALLQLITMNEQDFPLYRKTTDWMQTYVFPGSELASLSEILRSVGRATTFRPFHLEDLGTHYARTLNAWRQRFLANLDAVREQDMDERFIRTWDLYLAFCEAAFAERHISDVQLMLTRGYHDQLYFTDTGRNDITRQLVTQHAHM
jgi:cyclopropane-fatty-acyl-phospholipid synthase